MYGVSSVSVNWWPGLGVICGEGDPRLTFMKALLPEIRRSDQLARELKLGRFQCSTMLRAGEYDIVLVSATDGSVIRNLTKGFDQSNGYE